LDEKGVRVVTIWTSDAFLMPSTTFTCPWFMPMLRDWVGAKSDDEVLTLQNTRIRKTD
jgi:hypothetical protein